MEKLPQVPLMDSKVALIDIYETTSGVWDHLSDSHKKKNRPMASVALHDVENMADGFHIHTVIRDFLKNEIYKETGLNLNDFLALPRDIVQFLFKTIQDRKVQEDIEKNKLLNSLGQTGTKK